MKSARIEPTVTHFKAFFVTAGTTGSQTLTLETSTTITVEVGTITQILAGFNIGTLGRVESFVNRTVKKITASTEHQLRPGGPGRRRVRPEVGRASWRDVHRRTQ
ncbi:hypothetical protein [Nonomuraea sp. KM90]|uniref:hypothetical protein n=1 Tax=Nonomuraea sp. KM90 TaxID=3457428 RepID=UPI003FCE631C